MKTWTAIVTAMALVAACVGDDPAGTLGSSADAGSDAASSSGAGGGLVGDAEGGGSNDAGVKLPWGQVRPKDSAPLADARNGRRVVAWSNGPNDVLVDFFAPHGVKSRAAGFTSTAPLELTTARLDDAGNLYASFVHTLSIDIDGEFAVQQGGGASCTVLRLEASTGALTWRHTLSVAGPNAKLRCSVRRVLDGNALVIAGFGGGPLTSSPATQSTTPGGTYDGLVATLGVDTGARIYTRHIKGGAPSDYSDRAEIDLRDAHFTSPTTIAVVGSTSSTTVDLGDSKKLMFTPVPAIGVQAAGLLVRLDVLSSANNSGEIWRVSHPTANEFYESTMTLQSVAGTGTELAVVGSCYGNMGGSVAEFAGIEPLQLGNQAAVFAFGIGASRRLITQKGTNIDFFSETFIRVGQGTDGRVTLVGSSQPGLALGGLCDRGPRDQAVTYAASFASASLAACTRLREYPGAIPTETAGTGDKFVLSAATNVPVSFDGFAAPAGEAIAVELDH